MVLAPSRRAYIQGVAHSRPYVNPEEIVDRVLREFSKVTGSFFRHGEDIVFMPFNGLVSILVDEIPANAVDDIKSALREAFTGNDKCSGRDWFPLLDVIVDTLHGEVVVLGNYENVRLVT